VAPSTVSWCRKCLIPVDCLVVSQVSDRRRFRQASLSPHRVPSITALTFLLVVLYAPLVRVVVNSFNANEISTSWGGATLRWFKAAWSNAEVRPAIWTSAKLAVLTSLISVGIATLSVVALRALPRGRAAMVRIAALARIATPEIIVATGLVITLPLINMRLGFRAMLIGHVAYLTGFVVLLIAARADNADRRLEEAAQDLGARPWRVLFTIVLPDLLPAIGAAALLAAAFSFDDVALSRSLSSPQSTTLPLVLVSLAQRNPTPELDAIATLLLVIGIGLFVSALKVAGSISTVTSQRTDTGNQTLGR
jgi:ABC-type spermidine/putrescine transport system permease subunit II